MTSLVGQGVAADVVRMGRDDHPTDRPRAKKVGAAFDDVEFDALRIAVKHVEPVPSGLRHEVRDRPAGNHDLTGTLGAETFRWPTFAASECVDELGIHAVQRRVALSCLKLGMVRLQHDSLPITAA